jgi:hypothetical protein
MQGRGYVYVTGSGGYVYVEGVYLEHYVVEEGYAYSIMSTWGGGGVANP